MAKRRNWMAWGLAVLAVVVLAGCTDDFWKAPLLKREARRPTGIGAVSLVSDNSSFAGTCAWIVVSDPQRGRVPLPVRGCYGSDGPVKLQQAMWSRDGTVLALQARVGQSRGRRFEGAVATRFVAAYDYRQHRTLGGTEPTDALSRRIEQLLSRRGGKGQIIFRHPYDSSGKPIPSREAQFYAHPPQ